MAERDVIAKIVKAYRARGAYIVKIHGGPTQARTVDLLACYRGVFIGIEAKDGFGKEPTPMQRETLSQISAAGGSAIVAHDLDEACEVLDEIDARYEVINWLNHIDRPH